MQIGIDRKGIHRFFRYTAVGVCTFSLDLVLLYVLIDGLLVNYLVATALAFIISVSLNFTVSRMFAFGESERPIALTYIGFLGVGTLALFLITFSMYLTVEVFALHYFISRICIGTLVGFCNYLLNLYGIFDVAGKHK